MYMRSCLHVHAVRSSRTLVSARQGHDHVWQQHALPEGPMVCAGQSTESQPPSAARSLSQGIIQLWRSMFELCISCPEELWEELHVVSAALKALLAYSHAAKVGTLELVCRHLQELPA